MSERAFERLATTVPCNETIALAIAGPETAARLRINVGDVFEARHTATPVFGDQPITDINETIVTPQEAGETLARFRGEED